MFSAQPSGSMAIDATAQFARLVPSGLKDSVIRYMGKKKCTTTLLRQINACFECAGIELIPRSYIYVIILRVSGDALQVLEQNRHLVECLNDTSDAASVDVWTCKSLLTTRFDPSIQETKKDWIEDLAGLRQESVESLKSYHNREAIMLKNLDIVYRAKKYYKAGKYQLSTICMAYYTGFTIQH